MRREKSLARRNFRHLRLFRSAVPGAPRSYQGRTPLRDGPIDGDLEPAVVGRRIRPHAQVVQVVLITHRPEDRHPVVGVRVIDEDSNAAAGEIERVRATSVVRRED